MGASGSTAAQFVDDRSTEFEYCTSSKRVEHKKVGRIEPAACSSSKFIDDSSTIIKKSGSSSKHLVGRNMEVSGPSWKFIEEQMVKDDACSLEKKGKWYKDRFADFLLSMSIDEISNANLYINQVKLIPNAFQNVDEYLGSYIYPLMEETRAELSSALEAIRDAPFAEVTCIVKWKNDKLMYEVTTDYWRNKISDRGKEPYTMLPGDVVVFSDVKPETRTDLQWVGSTCTFVLVQSVTGGASSDCYPMSNFKVKIGNHTEAEDLLGTSLYVVFLMNISTNKRIWNALHSHSNLKIIEHVLSRDKLDAGSCTSCSLEPNKSKYVEFGSTLLANLDESQNKAITASLRSLECNHKPSVQLIWGPPGTGKTKTLSVLLYILLRMGVRTLICAPTNVAVSELAARVVKLVRDSSLYESCSLSDILIFGNKAKLKSGPDMEEISLDFRASKLLQISGWKKNVMSMIDFLDSVVSWYPAYLDNELKGKGKISKNIATQKPKSILEFARKKFKDLVSPLRECMVAFTTHLPIRSVREKNVQCILHLLPLLDSIEEWLFQEDISCKEFQRVFSCEGGLGLPDVKSRCLSTLRALGSSLRLELPFVSNERSIEEFCFQQASLVFCTASSSFKLHHVKTQPFDLLVVDEAAQLKECELVIALQIPDLMHAILAGDEKQLPTTVTSLVSEAARFGRSLFGRLSSLGQSNHLLDMQYRMHPSISFFPNINFYNNRILDAPSVQRSSYKRYLEGKMFGPYSFIDIVGGSEQLDDLGRSRRNMVEVAVVVKLVQKLFKEWLNGSIKKLSIGVISPYAAQVVAIQRRLKNYENHEGFGIKVKSIDGFQGCEEDIIIMSTVRTNKGGSIGFLASPQRTNVALTRARYCLWILGSAKTLSSSSSVWEMLVLDAKRRRCFFTADEDNDTAKTIMNVKKELDQLDGMLNADSILFKNAIWKVIFSNNFRKSFRILNSYVKKLVVNLLLKIASGWRPKKINVDVKLPNSLHVLKQFKVEDYFVVCSIDVMKEDSVYQQVLKVWDIIPLGWNTKLLDQLASFYAMYTDEFANLCMEKCFEGNLEVPKSWPNQEKVVQFKKSNDHNTRGTVSVVDSRSSLEITKVSESLVLTKFYSLSNCVMNHLLSDNDGKDIGLPFEVTNEEREVIMFPRSSFILGRSGTGKTTVLTMKLYRTMNQNLIVSEDNLRQLFVSVSPKLCYAVKEYISQLKRFAIGDFSTSNTSAEMDDLDAVDEFKDIPDSFVGIKPEKYPLILTFRKFTMMLDGTLGESYFKRFRELRDSPQYVARQTFIRKREVTYARFHSSYWPHFNAKMTKNFDPSRVYTEIMSHIKGGLHVEFFDMKLKRQEYVSLSDTRASTLSAQNREMIYNIFEHYEKMKMERGGFDLADLVIDIHRRLKHGNMVDDKMDFVYIDEVQDLTMRQIALFKHICKNVDEGFVFCGDTAQTIARGIDFRFEDIRSLFYNEFLMKSKKATWGDRNEKGQMSDTFCLSQNFRTHSGVIRLAGSIIDLLCHFFPQSIDVLAPESSLIYGEPPILLEPGSDQNSIVTIFGQGTESAGNLIGFGAEQVILVRDDYERDEITKQIGHQAIVLTIVECKGLEFQDVLLYNFFGSSPMCNQWRVVYQFLNEKKLLDNYCPESFPSFTPSKHNILCSELKQLYVAITRTKQRLLIFEKDEEIAKPMFDYWRRLSLVQLFWEKNYEMATMCFEKAGEKIWEKRSKASGLRLASDRLRDYDSTKANILLAEAAEIFASIGRADSAAECFCDSGEYERAGLIYRGIKELRKSGECFSLAGSYTSAAEVFLEGNYFGECLSACRKGKNYDTGLQYIENWRRQGLSKVDMICRDFLEGCAREFCRAKDRTLLLKFVRAFPTMDSRRHFLKSLDCLEALIDLEEECGNFLEAANIAKVTGDLVREADLLGKMGNFGEASDLIISYVLSNSLWTTSESKSWPLKQFPCKEVLLSKAKSFSAKVSGSFHALICTEAEILSDGHASLSALRESFIASKKCQSQVGEILSVLKLLDAHFRVNPEDYKWGNDLHFCFNNHLDESNLQNQFSVRTLTSTWNSHTDHILEILKCLDSIDRLGYEKCESTLDFCFKYFGVRVLDSSTENHRLLNPKAEWIKNVGKRFIWRKRSITYVDPHHFVLASRMYWHQHLISVGIKVLETLQALLTSKHSSNYCESICLICIFNVATFFIGRSRLLNLENADLWWFQDFVGLSMKYVEIVFPLDPRQSLSANMISLRETENSKNLLDEVMSRNVEVRNELTNEQIGRIIMIWLGSGRPRFDVYGRVLGKIGRSSLWGRFLQKLDSPLSYRYASQSFYAALNDTDISSWKMENSISPHCLLYVVEKLLIMVPHSRGYFYTTKSSFVEWSMCQESDVSASLVTDGRFSTSVVFDFVADLIRQILYDGPSTKEWIRKSNISCKLYHPVLVLRLVMIFCLLCLNSEAPLSQSFKLSEIYQFQTFIPREFCEAIERIENAKNPNVAVNSIFGAFKVIGDPVVIVGLGDNKHRLVSMDATFIDLKQLSSKQDIVKALVQPSTETVVELPSLHDNQEVDGEGINWEVLRGISNMLESMRSDNYVFLKGCVLAMKEKVNAQADWLVAAIPKFHVKWSDSDSETTSTTLSVATEMVVEFERLLCFMDKSEFDDKHLEILHIVKNLISRKPQIEALLRLMNDDHYVESRG